MHFDLKVYGVNRNKLYRLLGIMKFAVAILLLSLTSVSASTFGQRISLREGRASLTTLLAKIERQIPYRFVYDNAEIGEIHIENAYLDAVDLHTGLDMVLRKRGLDYKIVDDYILVKKMDRPNIPILKPLQTMLRGTVRDEAGKPIEGVTISIKGQAAKRSNTDENGTFTMALDPGNTTLILEHIAYATKEVETQGQPTLVITLQPQMGDIEEVVVVGYGTQKKANLTGAVSAISGEELENRPIANVGQGLQGQLPGLTVRSTGNTAPGNRAPQFRIRGVGTWGDANPLIVIDGIPGGNLNILNPDDIESVSVLKDAASSSIYGVRGANGVIMVTTKKGTSGTPNISLSSYMGWQTPTALPKFLGSADYMTLQNEANVNAGQNPTYTPEQIEIARNGSDPNYFANTDWISEVYRSSAPQQNHNLSMNGGADKTQYYASYGYLNEGGLVVGDNFKAHRHNARLRVNTQLLDRLNVDGNLGYVDRSYDGSANGLSALSAATSIRPLVPVRFTNGSWGYHGGQSNPAAIATDGGTNSFTSQEITANISATLNLFKGLDLKGQYGLVKYNSKRTTLLKTINYYSPDDNALIYQTNFPNRVNMDHYSGTYQTFIGTATYIKSIKEKHNIKGLLGYSLEENVGNDFGASRTHLPVDLPSLAIGTENQLNSSGSGQNALMSFFGRVNYDFDNKYLLEGNFRRDGSSRFHPDVRWNWFGSFSAGWVFTEERFFEPLKSFWNFGKLRFSYGTQGNDKVGRDHPFMAILASAQITSNNPIGNVGRVGFRQNFIPNELVSWESSEKLNAGLDLAFLSRRLNVTAEYFVNKTNALLLNTPLPDVIGVGGNYPAQNAGAMENRGWELALSWQDKIGDFGYRANVNLSDVRNKVTRLDDYAVSLGDKVRIVGAPFDALYGFRADRIAQVSDFDVVNGEYVPKFPFQRGDLVGPGDLIYIPTDPNATEITVGADRHVLGSEIPRYTYGFRGDLSYKNVDFSFFLQGVGKADGYLTGNARHPFINNSAMPQDVHLDRWTPENTDASYPRFVYMRTHNTRLSSKWVEDASYLRLKNVQVGYTFSPDWTEKIRISKFRIYASADNLLTKTDFFYGYDPEVPTGNSGDYYPQVKTFIIGLNLNLK
ncbi:SusC/RagA family TonB-linked outer membrane protein [Sphingobacterium paludis]|uniref:TonB-linked SusC/RagA family outer membrane protein n=1 Tax=Sphingobacterium paludis TaxID=1476465 RepID=A0A4R7CVM0_9SPHI|nr:TonB-dependent receptor [Sphingobacterium paludis]TDS11872.1 TonB-linked SusC/RagA family outer membrane protein [Sphingobacterium paludis]